MRRERLPKRTVITVPPSRLTDSVAPNKAIGLTRYVFLNSLKGRELSRRRAFQQLIGRLCGTRPECVNNRASFAVKRHVRVGGWQPDKDVRFIDFSASDIRRHTNGHRELGTELNHRIRKAGTQSIAHFCTRLKGEHPLQRQQQNIKAHYPRLFHCCPPRSACYQTVTEE